MKIRMYIKLVIYALVIWLFPFLLSFLFFKPDGTMAISMTFFKSIMIVASTLVGVFAIMKYLRSLKDVNIIREAWIAGLVIFAVNIAIDVVLVFTGFFNMSLSVYFTDIGLRYVNAIIISVGMGHILKN
ncbi:hypothetical protein K9M79_01075 [Candidatus Woesearchaeota archaeon]|nr:hypothetical protein [Candidatus Woesearchaeota archaeon]